MIVDHVIRDSVLFRGGCKQDHTTIRQDSPPCTAIFRKPLNSISNRDNDNIPTLKILVKLHHTIDFLIMRFSTSILASAFLAIATAQDAA